MKILTAEILIKTFLAASKDETRFAIQNVFLEKSGSKCVVCATNGFFAVKFEFNDSHLDENSFKDGIYIFNKCDLEDLKSEIKKSKLSLNLREFFDFKKEVAEASSTADMFDKIMQFFKAPLQESLSVISFNLDYLSEIQKITKPFIVKNTGAKVSFAGELKPVFLEFKAKENDMEISAIVMPMKL